MNHSEEEIAAEAWRLQQEAEAAEARDRMNGKDAASDEGEVSQPGAPMPNVRRFIASEFGHKECALLVHQGGQFYEWDGSCWPALEDPTLRARLYAWFEGKWFWSDGKIPTKKPFDPTTRKVRDLQDAAMAIGHIPTATPVPSWFGPGAVPADEVIACENGLIHWPSRKLHPHTPRFYAHHAVPFAFDPKAPSPERWLEFLYDLWGDDLGSIGALQELFGYVVSGDTRQQKMFLLVGPKRGGKGTIARVLRRLIGAHNVAGPTLASFATNFGLQDLVAKSLAVISDARLGNKSDHSIVAERLLSITGEDTLTVDRKYLPHWTGQLPTRILMLTNELPALADASGALASRFVVFVLTQSFYNRENPALTELLCQELPGIFLWALDGLQRLHERGHFIQPKTSADAVQQMADMASPVAAFIRDNCVIDLDATVDKDALYKGYRNWCEEKGHTRHSAHIFARNLYAGFPHVRPTKTMAFDGTRLPAYAGLRLLRG